MEQWFGLYLRAARVLGYEIIWTAHDLLPHQPLFESDARARTLLLSKTAAVIALSESTATELRALGARHVRVIPMGSYAEPYPLSLTRDQARASFGFDDDDSVVCLIGRIEEYKGADRLIDAIGQLPRSSRIKLLLAGTCPDENYHAQLERLIKSSNGKVIARFQWIANDDLARYLQASDFAAFPFREITNSGSINLAQSFGLPVVIPNLPALRDIPSDAAIRFEPETNSLVESLIQAENLSAAEYHDMSSAALAWATRTGWEEIAQATVDAYEEALRPGERGSLSRSPLQEH
jgi:glycosyltransferase involved in cell wall biosynthesis